MQIGQSKHSLASKAVTKQWCLEVRLLMQKNKGTANLFSVRANYKKPSSSCLATSL